MDNRLMLSAAAEEFGGTLVNSDCVIERVSIDSRQTAAGDVFVALIGQRFDGHDFIAEVADQACGLVVQKLQQNLSVSQWVVPDTTRALGQLAALKRRAFDGPVIAVTGSCGKTTVKEMIAAILTEMGAVLATRGNLNNHVGVPLTLLSLNAGHEFAVIEMGASAAGEIAYLCEIAKPDIVLVNNIMPAHLSGFGSLDATARAKGEIYESLKPGGIAVLNIDEPYWSDWGSNATVQNQLTYALDNSEAGFYASNIQADPAGSWRFTLHSPIGEAQVKLPLPGKHNIANALAAAACSYAAGADLEEIVTGLGKVKAVGGRTQLLPGIKGARIIDDSYNANPGSMRAAIDTLAGLPGKPLLVLGDMAELGPTERQEHFRIGEYAARAGIPALLATGELSAETVAGFGPDGELFPNKEALLARLKKMLTNDSIVLIKGSRSAGMESIVKAVTLTTDNTKKTEGSD